MSGYMIPEVWCDGCGRREVSEDVCTLREWRAFLRDDCDWVRRRVDGELLDLCKRCNERKDD